MLEKNTLKSTSLLMLTAFLWGMGFVAQKSGMDHVGPLIFAAIRYMFAALTIFMVIIVTGAAAKRKSAADRGGLGEVVNSGSIGAEIVSAGDIVEGETGTEIVTACDTGTDNAASADMVAREIGAAIRSGGEKSRALDKYLMKGGIVCGIVLFLATSFQQAGIVTTTASKTGFLTALYMVLVPVLGIFLKKHTHWNTWVSVAIAAVGLYFLCITDTLTIMPGDLIVLLGAFLWAGHILVIDHYVPSLSQRDILKLVTMQFLMAGALSFLAAPLLDHIFVSTPLSLDVILQAAIPLLYAGVISAGIGFTLQAVGQKYANPTAAAIILSLESVFSVIGGILILGEQMTGREALGCVLMFGAVILAQVPVKGRDRKNERIAQ